MQGDSSTARVTAPPEAMRLTSEGTPVVRPIRACENQQRSLDPRGLKARLAAADMGAVLAGLLLAFGWRHMLRGGDGVVRAHLALAGGTLPLWLAAFAMNRLYLARPSCGRPRRCAGSSSRRSS